MDICSITVLMGCWDTIYVAMVFSMGCRRIFSFPTWSIFFTGLGAWRGCFSHICTFNFLIAASQSILPFLEYVIAGAPLVLLVGSSLASSQSVLEPDGRGCVWQGDSCRSSHKAPLLPKSCHVSPMKYLKHNVQWMHFKIYLFCLQHYTFNFVCP